MKILLIRHGQTAGNLEKRYIGRTDEPLCPEGIAALKQCNYEQFDVLVSSPMKRCLQTAEILFPLQKIRICKALRECDFGDFEGKNYSDLNGDPLYQSWIDSGGTMTFPNGESPALFRTRCCAGFREIVEEYVSATSIAFVVHGGTIMSILSQFCLPNRDYFDWMTNHTHGWLCEYDGTNLINPEKI